MSKTPLPLPRTRPILVLVGYYHLADGFKTAVNFLQKDFEVLFFPLSHYHDSQQNYHDASYDVETTLVHYLCGQKCVHYECGLVPNNKPVNVVLFWQFRYFCETSERLQLFNRLKTKVLQHHSTVFLAYNWDPICPMRKAYPAKQIELIASLNCYLTCDGREIGLLRDQGIYNCEYCPPGFDPGVTHFIHDPAYACDVSIVCTNLYAEETVFPHKYVRINRKALIDLVYGQRNELRFNLYGPPCLGQMYPECYRGPVSYEECPRVFSNSKINLCIHATSHNNSGNFLYFSERLPQILGSHGLLYCETEYNYMLEPGVNYILADSDDPIKQIRGILERYETPEIRRIKANGQKLAKDHMTWDNLRLKIGVVVHRQR